MKTSVIIPCYNSTPILEKLLSETEAVLGDMGLTDHEIILVNDCSPHEETLPFLTELVRKFPKTVLIDLAKNTGQANAQMAALNYASGDIVINMDDDMQTHPKNIPLLYAKLMEGYDLVEGRYPAKKHSFFRNFLTKADNVFECYAIDKPKGLHFTSFWIARRYIVDEMVRYDHPYAYMEGLFLRTAGRIANQDVEHFERTEGESGYTFGKLVKLWSNFTNFTVKPLRLAGFLGAVISLISFIAMIVIVIRRITDPDMPMGYASLLCTMLILFGVVLIGLGIIGEYVGRIFMCVNRAPQFVVRRIYRGAEASGEKPAVREPEVILLEPAGEETP